MLAVGRRLVEAAQSAKSYGLAGAHLGEVSPVIAISTDGQGADYSLLFNPRVSAAATETVKGTEGSVSLPSVQVEIDRPVWVQVDYMDPNGKQRTTKFEGFAARVVQHEIEQTQGIFFLDKLSRLKRDMVLKKLKKHAG